MNRLKKFVGFLFILVLLLVSFAVTLYYQKVIDLPVVFLSLEKYPLVGPYMPIFLFYSGFTLLVLSIISLIVVILSPVNQKYLLLKKEHSTIKIEQRALESMLLSEVQKIPFIKKATVHVKIFKKHKRMVSVIKGQITPDEEVATELNELIQSIEQTFEKMFALPKDSVRLKLRLTPHKDELKKANQTKRVA